MATITSAASGLWSDGATWVGGIAPVNDDTVVIDAGHTVTVDFDGTGWANGVNGMTITSHATDPGMLTFKNDADGVYGIKLKTGTKIVGTDDTVRGRILANSDGVWGNTGTLPFGRKAIIICDGTSYIDATYLTLALHGTEPTNKYVTTYGTKFAVSTIDLDTNVITMASAHGWPGGRAVKIRTTGTFPGGLNGDSVYYVNSPSGAQLKLTEYSSNSLIDITSAGTGTIEIYDGHQSTSTAVMNVLEDVSADAQWADGAGYVLSDDNAPQSYDIQLVTQAAKSATTVTLSANVNSVQFPGARIWLRTRNVAVRTTTTSSTTQIINGGINHILACEVSSTSSGRLVSGVTSGLVVSGIISGGYVGLNNCSTATISGTVSGCSSGLSGCTSPTISGAISGCEYGLTGCHSATISGTVSGCSYGLYNCNTATISGTVSGCNYGLTSCDTATVSGTVSSCSSGLNNCISPTVIGTVSGGTNGLVNCTSATVSGAISGCSNGLRGCNSATVIGTVSNCSYGLYECSPATISGTVSGCSSGLRECNTATISGTVSGCSYGLVNCISPTVIGTVSGGTNGLWGCSTATVIGTVSDFDKGLINCASPTVSGTVSGCEYGLYTCTSALLAGCTLANTTDCYQIDANGYGVLLNGTTQSSLYLFQDNTAQPEGRYGITIKELGGTTGYGFWTLGGVSKTAVYAAGTHGTPPVETTEVQEMTLQDNRRRTWWEIPILAPAGKKVDVVFYGKMTATAAETELPKFGIYDPGAGWMTAEEILASSQQVANTDWQTHTLTFTATYDREIRIRVHGTGGTETGTGTDKLYWFHSIAIAGEGGGGGGGAYPVIGSSIVRSATW